jgi:hypothetical protein
VSDTKETVLCRSAAATVPVGRRGALTFGLSFESGERLPVSPSSHTLRKVALVALRAGATSAADRIPSISKLRAAFRSRT